MHRFPQPAREEKFPHRFGQKKSLAATPARPLVVLAERQQRVNRRQGHVAVRVHGRELLNEITRGLNWMSHHCTTAPSVGQQSNTAIVSVFRSAVVNCSAVRRAASAETATSATKILAA
jgi:hypothetical protein